MHAAVMERKTWDDEWSWKICHLLIGLNLLELDLLQI